MQKTASNIHTVQLYQDETFLIREISSLTESALKRGAGVVLVATDTHNRNVIASLLVRGLPVSELVDGGRLTFAPAEELMSRFMTHHSPDRELFNATVGRIVEEKLRRCENLFIYGEMVNVLWQDGHGNAAVRLEELWNELGARFSFRLSCSYKIDFLDPHLDSSLLRKVCHLHSQARCGQDSAMLEASFHKAFREILGPDADMLAQTALEGFGEKRSNSPAVEGLLWLRENLPEAASLVLDRAKIHAQTLLRTTDN